MANAQQQPQGPRMHNIFLNEIINGDAFESLEIVIMNPGAPLADQVLSRMPVQIGPSNAERLVRGVTSDGDGVLHVAARSENIMLVRAIFQLWSGAVDVAATNKRGETALHCAAATGNAGMVTLLILNSMAPENNAPDNDKKRQLLRLKKHNGETCLHDAVRSGKIGVVEVLVEEDVTVVVSPKDCHALVRIHDKEGVSPLYLATSLRQLEIVKFLTKQQEPVGTYPAASYDGPGNKTALHAAVFQSKAAELSRHLAEWNNELIERADISGRTPLHFLASTKDKFTMKLLLDLDTNAGYQADKDGSLPIHVAAAYGSREIVGLLSKHRTSCSWSCTNQGQTVLHIAVINGESDVVDYVCSEQKFVRILNKRDINGNTALHLAVLQGSQFIFCRLMRRMAISLSVTNRDERTPLDLASLGISRDISFAKTPRHWIMYSLVVAGADHGTYLPRIGGDVEELDLEKESKSIGKSAAVLAVCAVLTLTTAIAEPLSVTKFYDKIEKHIARRFAYRIFVIMDVMAFVLSVASISSCTLAGFSFANRRKQLQYLYRGLVFLVIAAMFIIIIFMAGLYLAVGSVVDTSTVILVCLPGASHLLMLMTFLAPVSSVILHTQALISRLGCSGWSGALICLLPPEHWNRTTIRFRARCVKCMVTVFLTIGMFILFVWVAFSNRKVE